MNAISLDSDSDENIVICLLMEFCRNGRQVKLLVVIHHELRLGNCSGLDAAPARGCDDLNLRGAPLQGQRDTASEQLAAFRASIHYHPKHALAYNNLGNALQGKGQVEEAIDAYRKAIEIDPQHAMAYQGLGRTLLTAGDISNGKDAVRTYLRLAPDDVNADVYRQWLANN